MLYELWYGILLSCIIGEEGIKMLGEILGWSSFAPTFENSNFPTAPYLSTSHKWTVPYNCLFIHKLIQKTIMIIISSICSLYQMMWVSSHNIKAKPILRLAM